MTLQTNQITELLLYQTARDLLINGHQTASIQAGTALTRAKIAPYQTFQLTVTTRQVRPLGVKVAASVAVANARYQRLLALNGVRPNHILHLLVERSIRRVRRGVTASFGCWQRAKLATVLRLDRPQLP